MTALPLDPIAEARRHWESRGWGDAAPGMAAVTSVMRAQQILLQRVDAVLRPLRLTFARYEVLMLLEFSRKQQLPMRVIGDRLQVHPTSITNAVDRLESGGLVQRREHPTDRRAVLVVLLPEGRAVAQQATTELNARVFSDLGVASPEVDAISELLGHLRAAAGDFDPAATRNSR